MYFHTFNIDTESHYNLWNTADEIKDRDLKIKR